MRMILLVCLLLSGFPPAAMAEGEPPPPACVFLPTDAVLEGSETGEPSDTWFFRYSYKVPNAKAAVDQTIQGLEASGRNWQWIEERLFYECDGRAVFVTTAGSGSRGYYDVSLAPLGG